MFILHPTQKASPSRTLLGHPLWAGSIEAQMHDLEMLSILSLQRKVDKMRKLDDLTDDEKSLLAAIDETLENHEKDWVF